MGNLRLAALAGLGAVAVAVLPSTAGEMPDPVVPIAVRLTSASTGLRYVVLGDSVPYGHGLANPTAKREGKLPPDQGPSTLAWPSLVDRGVPGLAPLAVRPTGCVLIGSKGRRYDQLAVSGAPVQANRWTGLDTDCDYTGVVPPHKAVVPNEIQAADLPADPPGLVTIQAGADDINFAGCLAALLHSPSQLGGDKCVTHDSFGFHLTKKATTELSSVTSGLGTAIREIAAAAPSARILLVNYYQIIPAATAPVQGTSLICRDIRIGRQGSTWRKNLRNAANFVQKKLNAAIAAAGDDNPSVKVIDTSRLFDGHEMCTRHAWLFDGGVNSWRAAHPNATGQAKIAAAVIAACSKIPGRCLTDNASGWGAAEKVAGNLGGNNEAQVESLSCASHVSCAAGGYYTTASGNIRAFVVNEVDGRWGAAKAAAGNLDTGGSSETLSVSCASAGNCAAAGYYGVSGATAFVVSEIKGIWGPAQPIGLALYTSEAGPPVDSVSCASAGNCTVGGDYTDTAGNSQSFVATEVNGNWGAAQEVAGNLNSGGVAAIDSISCASSGNCTAGGHYSSAPGRQRAFVISETNSIWSSAQEVAGNLNSGDRAAIDSVSCASPSNCAAGGYFTTALDSQRAFVISETNGIWSNAQEVAGGFLNEDAYASVSAVSCVAAGNCAAAGTYDFGSYAYLEAFVISEANGTWGRAEEVAGSRVHPNAEAVATSLSCASAGNCAVGGNEYSTVPGSQALIVREAKGIWGNPEDVAANLVPAGGQAGIISVSCTSDDNCSAGGYYVNASDQRQAFVVSQRYH